MTLETFTVLLRGGSPELRGIEQAKEVGKPEKIVVSAKDFNLVVKKLGETDDTD